MDRAVRHLKYNDGIKDIFDKIKSKISEFAAQFRDIPLGRKLTSLFFAALSAANAAWAAKNISDITKNIKRINGYNKAVKEYVSRTGDTTLDPSGERIKSDRKTEILLSSVKLISALLITFTSAVNAKLAIAKKQVQEGEDEERIIAETMTL